MALYFSKNKFPVLYDFSAVEAMAHSAVQRQLHYFGGRVI